MEGGLWTDWKLRWTPFQSFRCRSREHESRGRGSPSKTLMSSEPRLDAQVAMESKTTKEHRPTQIAAERESKNASQSNLSGGLSLRKADGWNLKNHSHLTVARHLREKTHPSMLVVTIREGEERGICSAALRDLLRIVKDQIEERGAVIIVMNRESAIWRKGSLKTVKRENQLKYVDVEETRVITNRCVAEQIKRDKVDNVVDGWIKNWKFWKNEGQQNLKSIVVDVMGGVRTGKVGKLGNCKIDEEMWCQSEEQLCKSIVKGLARRNRERHAMLADVEEEQEQDVICFDDITGKKLLWHAVRKARELEL